MAATKRNAYTYALTYDGEVLYVGKGTGNRLRSQKYSFGLEGHEVCSFESEKLAYAHERELIAELSPRLNRHPGGNGSWSKPPQPPKYVPGYREINKIGTRAYAAKILLWWHDRWNLFLDPAKELAYWKIYNGCA